MSCAVNMGHGVHVGLSARQMTQQSDHGNMQMVVSRRMHTSIAWTATTYQSMWLQIRHK